MPRFTYTAGSATSGTYFPVGAESSVVTMVIETIMLNVTGSAAPALGNSVEVGLGTSAAGANFVAIAGIQAPASGTVTTNVLTGKFIVPAGKYFLALINNSVAALVVSIQGYSV